MSSVFCSTAEARWFLQGQPAPWDEILRWFTLCGTLEVREQGSDEGKQVAEPFVMREKERTDKYLLFPDTDSVSIKQRQGKLEVKALVAGPRPFSLSEHAVVGRIDQWIKWSFESSLQNQLEAELDQRAEWRKVVKERYLLEYSFDSGQLAATMPDASPQIDCGIELTRIRVEARITDWLTLGFEAFGPSGRIIAALDESLQHFFTVHGQAPFELDGRDSLSYPAWLAMLR